MSPRAKLVLLGAFLTLPIVASVAAYLFLDLSPTANHGELLLPPQTLPAQAFERPGGGELRLGELAGSWVAIVSDSGACPASCERKLAAVRQARLALGRDASRVQRVFIVDDLARPAESLLAAHPGLVVAYTPKGAAQPAGPANDRAHTYLVDPHGNVMMRWPAGMDAKRILSDLKRLLKASQIG